MLRFESRPWKLVVKPLIGQRSIGRYGVIGLSGSLLDFFLFTFVFLGTVPTLFANFVSTAIGTTNNYLLNSVFNFQMTVTPGRLTKFWIIAGAGFFLSSTLIILAEQNSLSPAAGKAVAILLVGLFQFGLNWSWTFAKSNG